MKALQLPNHLIVARQDGAVGDQLGSATVVLHLCLEGASPIGVRMLTKQRPRAVWVRMDGRAHLSCRSVKHDLGKEHDEQ